MEGKGESAVYLAHATYWMAPNLPSEALTSFAKTCKDKFTPRYADVCALTRANGFGIVAEAEGSVPGYVVARAVETRSRAAAFPHSAASNEPRSVYIGPAPAQIRRTETRISNISEGRVSDAVFAIPAGYRERKQRRW